MVLLILLLYLFFVCVYSCQLLQKLAERVELHRRCRWLFDLVIGKLKGNSACGKKSDLFYFIYFCWRWKLPYKKHKYPCCVFCLCSHQWPSKHTIVKSRLDAVNDHSIFFLELKLWCDLLPFFPSLASVEFILRTQRKHNTELSSKSNPLYFKTDD